MPSAVRLTVILLFWAGYSVCSCESPEERLRQLLGEATRVNRPQPWARILMEADAEAVKLERREHTSNGWLRCVRVGEAANLCYCWNEIQGIENYQHDLLREVVRTLWGTPAGADALVALLRLGPYWPWLHNEELMAAEWLPLPLHQRIINIIDLPSWQKLKDSRLIRIQAEAYETWWSLSCARPDDPELSQNDVKAADFTPGADAARRKAIELYRAVVAIEGDVHLRRRIADLQQRRDTHQRAWFDAGD